MCSISVKECTGNIYDFFASPCKNKAWLLGNDCNRDCFEVFFVCKAKEFVNIFWIYNNCHTLLGFRDCDLCSVKAGIFLRNFVEVYAKSVCKFTDGNRYTAGTEVITFLDDVADFLASEHTLDLTLCRRITFLDFCTADFDGCLCMYFGGTGSTADTVTSGTSSEKDDDIARIRVLTDDRASRSCTHNSTDLHTFCNVVRMIDFFDITGSQTNLVAIGAVAVSCTSDKFLLRKFALEGFLHRYSRVSSTCHTHCLIYISTSGKRVTDRTAEAGSSTTKRLDLCRMVVCLILEVDEPLFFLAVYIYRYNDAAGIDLIGFFLVSKFALGFQFLHCHQGKIHQADKFVVTAFVENFSVSKIFLISLYDRFFVIALIKLHIGKFCGECGMTAVIRPIGIQYTDLGHGRITFFFVLKIILNVLEILEGHCKIQGIIQCFEVCFRHILEAVKDLDILWFREYGNQCFRFLKSCLTGVYRVDAVMFDGIKFFVCYISFYYISRCRADDRLCISIEELHTLYSGICSLVELSRKIFYRKDLRAFCGFKFLKIQVVNRRLCKYGSACFFKNFI